MGMDTIALADAREIVGVDHVRGRRKGKHVSCLFENAPLRVVRVREWEEEGRRELLGFGTLIEYMKSL